jgi:predicted DsbA family dithiol-disulfide isomerase
MKLAVGVAVVWVAFAVAAAAEEEGPGAVVATAKGLAITEADLDAAVGSKLFSLETEAYNRKLKVLDDLIETRLEAQEAVARKISVDELVKTEVSDKTAPVSDADVNATYDRVKSRLPAGKTEAELKSLIAAQMRQRHEEARRREFHRELREKAGIRVLLDPPRLSVAEGGDPSKGPKDAPVTMIEFSDFQCPYCGRVAPVLKQLEDKYGDKLRLVFRNYPLPMHPQAPKAAEAAACAGDQDKFWEMHDRLFAQQDKLQVADLKAAAAELGLDAKAFDACLDSGKHEAAWKDDQKEGDGYGVSATPWFFINGRALSGAQPYENFARVIDDELQRREPPPKAN